MRDSIAVYSTTKFSDFSLLGSSVNNKGNQSAVNSVKHMKQEKIPNSKDDIRVSHAGSQKITGFWDMTPCSLIQITALHDVTPCSLVQICQGFGEICYLHI
jgi:hypothetical protein